MKPARFFVLTGILLACISSCKRDDLDFDKLSEQIAMERQIAMPLVFGEFTVLEMSENSEDSLIVIDGDTVKLVYSQDSVIDVPVKELLSIPAQPRFDYTIAPTIAIPLPPVGRIELPQLINDTIYELLLYNSMRIDSSIMDQGSLVLQVHNQFNHEVTLLISSASLRSPGGINFYDSITNISPNETREAIFPIDDYTMRTFLDDQLRSAISVKFTPVIHKNPFDDFINPGDNISIVFGVEQLDNFKSIFGFFGYQTLNLDTLINDFAPDLISQLEGELNVTNPKFRFRYENNMGIPIAVQMDMNLNHTSKPDVTIDFGTSHLLYSDNYLMPDYFGSFLFDRNTTSNIDELIALPTPEDILIRANAYSNLGEDSLTMNNWANQESMMKMILEVEVPLELRADLSYTDTLKIRGEPADEDVSYEIEYAEIHYIFKNYFPIGFGGSLIVYDSINNLTLGTIDLNPVTGLLIKPAPVDLTGNVVEANVIEYSDAIEIDPVTAENILTNATHLIFHAAMVTTDYGSVSSVRVGVNSKINFQFGLKAKGKYIVN